MLSRSKTAILIVGNGVIGCSDVIGDTNILILNFAQRYNIFFIYANI
jgi:hypothetical protein